MNEELTRRIEAIQADRVSGAHALAREALQVLRAARAAGVVLPAARRLCRAQPAMAPLWNAALEAIAGEGAAERFESFAKRLDRAPAALVRVACDFLSTDALQRAPGSRTGRPIHVVTFSASGSVLAVLDGLRHSAAVRVSIGEGRPGYEGRGFAAELVRRGLPVTYSTDAALSAELGSADAVLLGADAVGAEACLNKVGSCMLAAAAAFRQVPVFVAATRDKLVMPALWPLLRPADAPAAEVWDSAPDGVVVRNPYFEAIPLELITGIITDAGVLSPDMVAQACAALGDATRLHALALLQEPARDAPLDIPTPDRRQSP